MRSKKTSLSENEKTFTGLASTTSCASTFQQYRCLAGSTSQGGMPAAIQRQIETCSKPQACYTLPCIVCCMLSVAVDAWPVIKADSAVYTLMPQHFEKIFRKAYVAVIAKIPLFSAVGFITERGRRYQGFSFYRWFE